MIALSHIAILVREMFFRIGPRALIGAGSVVTKEIPEGVFAAGNPRRVIREIGR